MKDPVALAYSGRIPEARAAAVAQARSDDAFLVGQGLEALTVLGQQHGVRADDELDSLLAAREADGGAIARRAFEAAAALGSRALEEAAARRLAGGEATWNVLRYVGEWPSWELGRALAEGWDRLPPQLVDEALLTSCVLPVRSQEECVAWGRRVLAKVAETNEDVRVAALDAVAIWRPREAAEPCVEALCDRSVRVRMAAARALAAADPDRLLAIDDERGDELVELHVAAAVERMRRALLEP